MNFHPLSSATLASLGWGLLASALSVEPSRPLDTLRPVGQVSRSGAGHSQAAAFTRDGRFVVFASDAPNLVTNACPGPGPELFVLELASDQVTLVSRTPTGRGGNGPSFGADSSADGRWIAFVSHASDLVDGDTNGVADVFLHDRASGVTRLLSRAPDGSLANGESFLPRITSDGRRVLFGSYATNLVAEDVPQLSDAFLWDAATDRLSILSAPPADARGPGAPITDLAIAPDGSWALFLSATTNLLSVSHGGRATSAHLRALDTGALHRLDLPLLPGETFQSFVNIDVLAVSPNGGRGALTLHRASNSSNFLHVVDLGPYGFRTIDTIQIGWSTRLPDPPAPAFSRDGNTLVFVTSLPDPKVASRLRVWRKDQGVAEVGAGTEQVPVSALEFDLSADGTEIVFTSLPFGPFRNALPAGVPQLFRLHLSSRNLSILSVDSLGRPIGGMELAAPRFSPVDRTFLFQSLSGELVADDLNRATDVFLSYPDAGGPTLLSAAHPNRLRPPPDPGTLLYHSGVSADGRRLMFTRLDAAWPSDDTNHLADLHILDAGSGEWVIASKTNGAPTPVTNGFESAVLSASGRHVAFAPSYATWSALPQAHVRDLRLGASHLASAMTNGAVPLIRQLHQPQIAADGRYLAFLTDGTGLAAGSASNGMAILRDVSRGRSWMVQAATRGGLRHMSLSLAGLGGRVVAGSATNASTFLGTFFDPETENSEALTGDPGSIALISYDGRRILLVQPGGTLGGRLTLRRRDLPDSNWQVVVPAVDLGRRYPVEMLSTDGRTLVVREEPIPESTTPSLGWIAINVEDGSIRRFVPISDGSLGSLLPRRGSLRLSADGNLAAFVARTLGALGSDVYLADTVAGSVRLLTGPPIRRPTTTGFATGPLLATDGRSVSFALWSQGHSDAVTDAGSLIRLELPRSENPDADGDSLDDRWELAWFGNLLRDGTDDWDGDGSSEMEEFRRGTCPIDDLDPFRIAARRLETGGVELSWHTVVGYGYRVRTSPALGAPESDLGELKAGDATIARVILPIAPEGPQFFRVVVVR